MDKKIWKNLPTELIRRIILESNPTIDVQLYFKIAPKKIDEARIWRLWYLLNSHDGIVYNLETESLHIFRVPGCHIIRRPIALDVIDNGFWFFNTDHKEHMIEWNCSRGGFGGSTSRSSWITEFRILLKGSGIARCLNFPGSTF
jgi:hypothetical protein